LKTSAYLRPVRCAYCLSYFALQAEVVSDKQCSDRHPKPFVCPIDTIPPSTPLAEDSQQYFFEIQSLVLELVNHVRKHGAQNQSPDDVVMNNSVQTKKKKTSLTVAKRMVVVRWFRVTRRPTSDQFFSTRDRVDGSTAWRN